MRLLRVATIIGACLGLAGTVSADTIYVNQDGSGDYTTIQEAINASAQDDVIIVAPGTYPEAINIGVDHDLTLESSDGPEVTIIDGSNVSDYGLQINNGIKCTVQGFQFVSWGQENDNVAYRAIDITASQNELLIENCYIRKCRGYWDTGDNHAVYIDAGVDSTCQLRNCLIEGNMTRGLYLQGAGASAVGCTISGNYMHFSINNQTGMAVRVFDHATLIGCVVSSNIMSLWEECYGMSPGVWCTTPAYLIDNIVCGNGFQTSGVTHYPAQIVGPWIGSGNEVSLQCDFGDSPLGACCLTTECVETDAYTCIIAGGSFRGALTTCDQVDCSNEGNMGACCIDGMCTPTNEYACVSLGGEWSGAYTNCDDVACTPPPAIAGCCLSDECLTTTEALCGALGGTWQDEADCADTACDAWTGVCCVGSSCLEVTQAECFDAQGIFAGELTTCGDTDCPSVCSGDVNLDNEVDVNDILILIANYGPCP